MKAIHLRPGRLLIGALSLLAACSGETQIPVVEPLLEADIPHFEIRGRFKEPKLSVFIDLRQSPVSREVFESSVDRAIATWNATGLVELSRAEQLAGVAAILSFQRRAHGECTPFGTESTIAHTGPVELGTYIHFDFERVWSENGERGHSLYQAVLHELGHLLGLGHSKDEAALMFAAADPRRTTINRSDLAGIQTLYGGGEDHESDVELRLDANCASLEGEQVTVLRRVAPPEITDYSYFDSDGDGNKELLVWRTDRDGFGALTSYHFNRKLRVNKTLGPLLGTCPPKTAITFGHSASGERLIVRVAENDAVSVLKFDEFGIPRLRHKTAFTLTEQIGTLGGDASAIGPDADGDGFIDSRSPASPHACTPPWDWFGDLDGDGDDDAIRGLRDASNG